MSAERQGQYKVLLPGGGESPGTAWDVGLTLPPCLHSGLSKAVNISSAPRVSGGVPPPVWPRAGRSTSLGPGFPSDEPLQTPAAAAVQNSGGGGGKALVGGGVRSPEAGDDSPSWAPRPSFTDTLSTPSPAAGNAGMAAAYAARKLGIPATIVVPSTTPALTIERLKNEGAVVKVVGEVSTNPGAGTTGGGTWWQGRVPPAPHPLQPPQSTNPGQGPRGGGAPGGRAGSPQPLTLSNLP